MLSHRLDNGMVLAFGTPILTGTLRDAETLLPGLKSCILERERAEGGISRSNVGGWHSEYDFFQWPQPVVRQVRGAVETMTEQMMSAVLAAPVDRSQMEMRINGWANVSRTGAYNRPHIHHGVTWSGIAYVECGKPDPDWPESGTLEVYDPRTNVNVLARVGMQMREFMRFRPKPGMILLFPGWLSHFVHPYYGEGERISIAFDVVMLALRLERREEGGTAATTEES